ncbi:hypothetical protein ACNI3Q_02380 [Sphingomonas sp. FW199]|uniref:hypothetical protein n=1 Tax=Sphingomonas sp. FW199 TaxID=3400217 RepID=UPI003CEEB4B4
MIDRTDQADAAQSPQGASLLARVADRLKRGRRAAGDRRAGFLAGPWLLPLAILILWIPLAIWGGARLLEQYAIADRQAADRASRPAMLSRAVERAEHRTMAALIARPGVAAMVEQLARVLPADDRIVSAAMAADGGLTIEIMSLDPARLRAALRTSPRTEALRTRAERREDGAIRVTLSGRAP